MRPRLKTWFIALCTLLVCIIAFTGCGAPSTSDAEGSTPGSTPGGSAGATATPAPPPPHALAWFQSDSHNVGQIWASVNGGAPRQITHMPSSTADCPYNEAWSPPVFSPDLSKIVAAWGSADCTDGPQHGQVYIINASTGAATKAGSANVRLSLRQTGWMDNSHIWWIDGQHVYKFTVGGSATTLGTIGSFSATTGQLAEDAVLRGNTLFYTVATYTLGGPDTSMSYVLKRFDMSSHTVLAGSINLGTTNPCACSHNDALSPGFDVAADGAHIVYQKVAAAGSGGDEEGVGSSQFFYANADGSSATRIASVATAHSMVKMQLSPNGRLVAVARAEPTPSVFTASVSSAGGSGDSDMHFYSPDGRSYPVWKYDSATFWASTKDLEGMGIGPTINMERFTVGSGSGSVGAAGGANPWYTIGE